MTPSNKCVRTHPSLSSADTRPSINHQENLMNSLQSRMRQPHSPSLILLFLVTVYFPIVLALQTPTKCNHFQRRIGIGQPVFPFRPSRSFLSILGRHNTKALILAAAEGTEGAEDLEFNKPCVVQRLDLSDLFSRWKFLQKLLDAEVSAADANELLYRVLYSFITYPPAPSGKSEDSNVSPIPTDEKIEIIESLFRTDQHGNGSIFALRDPGCSPGHDSVLQTLEEQLLPDPREDEDAHKGAWDTIMEIHGKESVKVREQEGSKSWRARCIVARVLLYFDFLTRGVVEEPFS